MIKFTLDGIKRMGEADPKYGQAYWCTSTDVDLPIKFNSMIGDLDHKLEDGPLTIVAEESSNKRSTKGTDYIQLRKVRVAEASAEVSQSDSYPLATPKPTQSPSEAHSEDYSGLLTILKRIEVKVDKLIGEPDEPEEKTRDWANLGKDKVYDLDGEPLPEPPEDL